MISNIFVEMLAIKIKNKEINPNTGEEFKIEDIKKEEYRNPILEKIEELKEGITKEKFRTQIYEKAKAIDV